MTGHPTPADDRPGRFQLVTWAESAVRDAVDRVRAATAGTEAGSPDDVYTINGKPVRWTDLAALVDATRAYIDHECPPAVSPVQDTGLRERVHRAIWDAWEDEGGRLAAGTSDRLADSVMAVLAPLLAERGELRAELAASEQYHRDRDYNNARWVDYKNRVVARENAYRDQLATALGLWDERGTRPWLEALVPAAAEEITRLRAVVASRPALPDDTDDRILGAIVDLCRQAGQPLTDDQTDMVLRAVTGYIRSWLSAPATDPTPATEPSPACTGADDCTCCTGPLDAPDEQPSSREDADTPTTEEQS